MGAFAHLGRGDVVQLRGTTGLTLGVRVWGVGVGGIARQEGLRNTKTIASAASGKRTDGLDGGGRARTHDHDGALHALHLDRSSGAHARRSSLFRDLRDAARWVVMALVQRSLFKVGPPDFPTGARLGGEKFSDARGTRQRAVLIQSVGRFSASTPRSTRWSRHPTPRTTFAVVCGTTSTWTRPARCASTRRRHATAEPDVPARCHFRRILHSAPDRTP